MLELITKIICTTMFVILEFFSIKIILDGKGTIKSVKTIALLLINIAFTTMLYVLEYTVGTTLISGLLMILIFKLIFKESILKVTIAVFCFIILTALSDTIVTTTFLQFTSLTEYRSTWYFLVASNIGVTIITLSVLHIKLVVQIIQFLSNKMESKRAISICLFLGLSVTMFSILIYYISILHTNNKNTIMILFMFVIFLFLILLFIKELYNYDNLQKEYDSLFDYAKNFEDWIEEDQYNKHEYKNELGLLRTKITDKKILKEIDKIINMTAKLNQFSLDQLSRVPKGGLKGFIYYKAVIAYNHKVNLLLDISENAKDGILKLSNNQIEELSKLIGIYFDNAIEAAMKTKKKNVTLEIYSLNNELNFVFSNSYSKKIDLDTIDMKGISSNGSGRGNGLYFAKKILNHNRWIESQRSIINNFYIQKLKIKV